MLLVPPQISTQEQISFSVGDYKHKLCLLPHPISKPSNYNECCTIDYQSWNRCARTTNVKQALFCSCFYEGGTLFIMSPADTSLMNGRRLAMECNLTVGCRFLIHLCL